MFNVWRGASAQGYIGETAFTIELADLLAEDVGSTSRGQGTKQEGIVTK